MKLKRIMAIVLCFAMVLSTMGTVAFAAEETVVATVGGVEYSSFTEVLDAVKASTGNDVTLLADVSASGQNALDALTGDTIDLNNKTLTVEETNTYFSDGTTTFTNGNIVVKGYSSDSPFCGYTENAVIVFDDVVIKGDDYSTACALFNANKGKVEIKNSEITVSGDTTGGIVYGGAATIDGTSINATNVCRGITNSVAEIKNSSSFTFDGGETGFNNSTVTVDASEVTIKNATKRAVRLDDNTLALQNGATLTATDCVEDIVAYDEESTAVVNVDDSSTLEAVNNIVPETPVTNAVATVNGEKFTDLQEAIKAAAPDGTVEILADVTVDEWVMIAESLTIGNDNLITLVIDGMTINGNNHTLTINSIESAGNGGRLFYDATKLNINNLTIKYADGLDGAIGLKAGTIEKVTFDGCIYGVIPQTGDVEIKDCTFKTNGTSIYFEEERDGLVVSGCTFENVDDANVILLRGDIEFTNNTIISGRTVNVVSGSPVVTGNDFGDVRFKVYNEATATIENNEINVLTFNDDSTVNSTFGVNTLSDTAKASLDAAGVWDGVIETKEDLIKFNELGKQDSGVNNLQGKTFILANDINFEWGEWYPFNFYGTFVGNGHSIKNLTYIPNTDGRMGFFQSFAGNIEGGLTLDGIKGTVPDGGNFGGFARYLNGNIADVSVKNITLEAGTNVNWYIGGFGGYANSGNITDCSVENFVLNASALSAGDPCIGGFIGSVRCNPIYTNCDVKGFKVIINSTTDLGLAGFTPHTQTGWNNVKFVDCDVTGIDFTVTGRADVAGFVTWPGSHTSATNCHTVGKIDVTGVTTGNYAGGFYGNLGWNADLGQMGHFLTNCSADVDVLTKIVDAGGFIGSATVQGNGSKYLECTNCTASGDVTVVEGGAADVGAFAGSADRGVYTDCSASGTVTNNGTGKAGQFIGAFYDVTPKYDHRYPAGTRDYLVDEITVEDCAYTGASNNLSFIGYTDENANVTIPVNAAKIGDKKFETLAAAITAAQPNDTIVLLANITEDVTVNKSITIDGGNFKYTGNISVSGTTSEVTVKNVNFENGTGYAITTNRIKSITVEDCTVNNYGFGFLYANKSTPTVVVKNVTVDGGNYGFHWVYGTSATLENVTMTDVTYGLYIQNYAGKNITLKNCDISSIGIWERSGSSGVQTFKFEGTNTVATLSASQYAKYVLTAVDATLTAPEGSDVTTDIEGYFVKNVDGTYKVAEKVAQIGDNYYSSLQEAIDSAADNATITLVKDIANGTGVKVNSGKNFTLDLGGFTYTIASNPVGSKGTETNGFQLLKDSDITIKNGTITSEASSGVKLLVMNYANLTLDGVTLDGANLDDVANAGGYVMSNNNGTTVIKDSTITAPTDGVAFDVDYQASYPNGAKVSLEGNTTINGAIVYEKNAQNSLVKDTTVTADAPEGYKWIKVGAKYSVQALGEYSFVVEANKTEIVDSGSFVVEVKVSSEKVDNFHSSEYIVTYDPNLLTCAEDNGATDYDSTTGTLRLQCLDGADVNEVIGTLNFTTKEFYLTQETEIKVSGIVCATQYDTAAGTSEPVSDGAVVVLLKDSFNVTVDAGLEGDAVAYNKTDYVVRVAAENQDKQNTIKYTIKDANGNPVENSVILPAGTNEYTISGDDIIGDMTFEITDTYSIEIITDYVTGYALILVDGSADGYTYNGHQMLKINRASGTFEYNGRYGWLVDGSAPGTTPESVEAAAYAAIRAGEESKAVETGYDVNSYINGDRKINFYDVSAAYACQKIDFNLSDVDDYFYMELYLASDANCDGKVDSSDSAVISVNYN